MTIIIFQQKKIIFFFFGWGLPLRGGGYPPPQKKMIFSPDHGNLKNKFLKYFFKIPASPQKRSFLVKNNGEKKEEEKNQFKTHIWEKSQSLVNIGPLD